MVLMPRAAEMNGNDRYQVAFATTIAILLIAGAAIVIALFLLSGEIERLRGVIPFAVVGVAGLSLLQKGRMWLSFQVLVYGVWFCAVNALIWTNGLTGTSFGLLVLALVFAGWLAGPVSAVILTSATPPVMYLLAHLEVTGWPVSISADVTPYQRALVYSLTVLGGGALGYFGAASLRERLSRLLGSQRDLSARLAELQARDEALQRSQIALQESEARSRSIVEVAFDGVMTHDRGWILDANLRFAQLFGYDSPAELIGRQGLDLLFTPESREVISKRIASAPPLGSLVITGLRKDGSTFLGETQACDSTYLGKAVRTVTMRDITERKRAEDALRESEARFHSLTDLSSDWYWEQDRELRLSFHSSGFAERSGTTSNKLLGKCRWEEPDRFPLRGTWDDHRATLEAHEQFRDFEYVRIGDDGQQYFVSLSGVPVYDTAGNFNGYRGVGTNITERKRAEQALRAAEEQFRGLVEQSIAGTYIVQDGKFAYVNPRFAEIFGYASAEEIIGREALSVVTEKDHGTVAENLCRQLDGAIASISYEFTGVRNDRSTIEVGVHGAYATHLGRPAVIGMIQDISEKKRAEDQIRRYVAQLEAAFMSTVEVATTISEMRDPYTAGHERRVAEIAVAIGTELGFDDRRIEGLRVAGYLHDIGKITIPSEILSKPGKLSAIEYSLIKGHSQASYDILKPVEFPWPVAQVALQHHERMDGSGYPQGLKGEAILLEARIMAVADVVEAMSSHRPYRAGLGIEEALAEIKRGRGTAYDPGASDACLRLFQEGRYQLAA